MNKIPNSFPIYYVCNSFCNIKNDDKMYSCKNIKVPTIWVKNNHILNDPDPNCFYFCRPKKAGGHLTKQVFSLPIYCWRLNYIYLNYLYAMFNVPLVIDFSLLIYFTVLLDFARLEVWETLRPNFPLSFDTSADAVFRKRSSKQLIDNRYLIILKNALNCRTFTSDRIGSRSMKFFHLFCLPLRFTTHSLPLPPLSLFSHHQQKS